MDNTASTIIQAYMDYVLEHDKTPSSVYILAKKAGMKEEDFYEHFNSVSVIEAHVWVNFFLETKKRIEGEEVYPGYTVREKMLAFYYTFIEVLKANRSFTIYTLKDLKPLDPNPPTLKEFSKVYRDFVESLLLEGRESQEIVERTAFLMDNYYRIFWAQMLLVLRFWANDSSRAFEQTDIYIEKAVNFAFDAMGKTALDSAFDFAKFVFQNR